MTYSKLVYVLALLNIYLLAGCSSDESDGMPALEDGRPVSPPVQTVTIGEGPEGHGRFIGIVRIGSIDHFADAIVTEDGSIRLYVGGPGSSDGALQVTKPQRSLQLVGSIDIAGGSTYGSGVVFDEECAPGSEGCSVPINAEINVARISREIRGEVRLANENEDTWILDLPQWSNYYAFPSKGAYLGGQYEERLSALSQPTPMLIRADSLGRLSFESVDTGCVGSGSISPHLDGAFGVFDVELRIDACDAEHAFLNGELNGLASESASSVWNYDSFVRMWLSREQASSPAAITFLASRW